jgi:uncharacterized membrane protein
MPDALYDYLLLLHILAGMVWVGGGVLVAALASRALRDPDPGAVARFIGNLRVIGPLVLAPATVAVVGFGVWLVLDSAAWGFDQFWVQLALVLFVAAFVIGAAYQSRTAINTERAAAREDHDEARRQLALWSRGYRAVLVLLVAATWDMVTKPGL